MAYVDRLPLPISNNPVWVEFVNTVEQVLAPYLVDNVQKLLGVRDVNNFDPRNLAAKTGTAMLSGGDASYEGTLWNNTQWRVQLATMLGFTFYSVFTLPSQTFDQFVKMGVEFYAEQGTPSWVNFLGFATDSIIIITPLWAQLDPTYQTYINFQPEGSPLIGTPVWEGGDWYPTSHIDVTITANFSTSVALAEMINLLQFVAPINLVIRNVLTEYINIQVQPLYPAIAASPTIIENKSSEDIGELYVSSALDMEVVWG